LFSVEGSESRVQESGFRVVDSGIIVNRFRALGISGFQVLGI
jgi:hypothetical protein